MELCVALTYSAVILYKYEMIGKNVIVSGVFGLVYLSYALNYGNMVINLMKIIKNKLC